MKRLGIAWQGTISRWENGRLPLPRMAALAMQQLLAQHEGKGRKEKGR